MQCRGYVAEEAAAVISTVQHVDNLCTAVEDLSEMYHMFTQDHGCM